MATCPAGAIRFYSIINGLICLLYVNAIFTYWKKYDLFYILFQSILFLASWARENPLNVVARGLRDHKRLEMLLDGAHSDDRQSDM